MKILNQKQYYGRKTEYSIKSLCKNASITENSMCGICGYISNVRQSDQVLINMNNTMVHRGPDDSGIAQFEDSGMYIGMAHRRLSILDLSPLGHQPMYTASGDLVIVYNGEIYNYREIREKLRAYGIKITSNCDTEVVLEAYKLYGNDCVKMFNGMFAFAIYDKRERKIFAARDRMGKKPFYYYYDSKKQRFVFGSTLQPIMNFPGFEKIISPNSLYEYMYYGYITEPRSIYDKVEKLEPGYTLELVFSDFSFKKECYWSLYGAFTSGRKNLFNDYKVAKDTLRDCIIQSVKRRMISDVPLGTFLSGGIDSSLISAIAQSLSSKSINTFSIGFTEEKYDESRYAEEISKYLGTNHHSLIVTEEDLIRMADNLPTFYDEPFADSSQLPSMIVSSLAKQNITVALTGDGGDELFCGYEGYDNILKVQRYRKIGRFLRPFANIPLVQKNLSPRVLSILNSANEESCQWISVAQKRTVDNVMVHKLEDIRYDEDWMDRKLPIQNRRMLTDLKYYLPGDILHKVDRASMKYSLESRCPLLDYHVVTTSFMIPLDYMYRDGEKKYILKDVLYDYIPRKLFNRPKKGFSVPLKKILLTSSALDMIRDVSESHFIKTQGLFDYEGICKTISVATDDSMNVQESYKKNALNVLWNYYVFQNWYLAYMVS